MRTYDNKIMDLLLGFCALEYSPPDYGKTRSAATCIPPVAFINNEHKDPRLVLASTGVEIDYFEPDNFDDEMELLNSWIVEAKEGKLKYKTVFKDGLTFTQSQFKLGLEENRYDARVLKKEAREGMIDRFRLEIPDWGVANSMMIRNTSLLNKLSKFGVMIICTAIAHDNPKWNIELACGPALQGKEFTSVLQGFFDLIGLIVEPWHLMEDGTIKPPMIDFHSEDGKFLSRVTGEKLARKHRGPLNWTKIGEALR